MSANHGWRPRYCQDRQNRRLKIFLSRFEFSLSRLKWDCVLMPPRAVTKQAGIDEYKFRKRPPSKTGKRKRSVLHETKQWSHYLKLCSDWVTENKREHDVVAAIAGQHGVNERTLRDQWNKWKDVILSEGWNPSLVARVNKEYRGGSNRVSQWRRNGSSALACITIALIWDW